MSREGAERRVAEVFGAAGRTDLIRAHATWAETYDEDMRSLDMHGPEIVAAMAERHLRDRDSPILDAAGEPAASAGCSPAGRSAGGTARKSIRAVSGDQPDLQEPVDNLPRNWYNQPSRDGQFAVNVRQELSRSEQSELPIEADGGERTMATGLYVVQDGLVAVSYGARTIRISFAQYRANGYRPALEKLGAKPPASHKPNTRRPAGSAARPPLHEDGLVSRG